MAIDNTFNSNTLHQIAVIIVLTIFSHSPSSLNDLCVSVVPHPPQGPALLSVLVIFSITVDY